ncbi:vitamin K-dependent protein C isoform X2 [Folsomia candida]|uniref:Chymotrypsin-1 n=2 Tax=Folsomia candida TaxID=158441 RepID=A0A226EE12_FOLCA|nr:vitamin K-dependent protein C isoform X2 [Folsomia candida]OXA55660.1 Chymotrypsin-1 [Folsomia candida]
MCTTKRGKIVGYCANELPCCDFTAKNTGSCGTVRVGSSSSPSAVFQSPDYPDFSSGDLNCNFQFDISNVSNKGYDGIQLNFEDAYMEGPGFARHSPCETDMIFIRGFKYWQPPAWCGNLTGYVAVIDKTKNTAFLKVVNILALMSGFRYKWRISVSLIKRSATSKNSETEMENMENELYPSPNINYADIQPQPEVRQSESRSNHRSRFHTKRHAPIFSDNSEDEEMDPIAEPFIVNGEDTNITDVPWQASIRTFYPDSFLKMASKTINNTDKFNQEKEGCSMEGRHFCGASIISNKHVLCAAHCFHGMTKLYGFKRLDHVKVFLGETDLCEDDLVKYGRKSQNYSIDKIIFHYGYDDIILMHDVVILKLKEKIKFNDYIKPIALSKRNKVYYGQQAKSSGWGLTNLTAKGASLPTILQSTGKMFVENKTYCDAFLEKGWAASKSLMASYPKYYNAYESVFCTSSKNDSISKLVGSGDSGGSIIVFDKTHDPPLPVQIGIVSYGLDGLESKREHDNVFVDFFQSVSFYRDWIDLAMSV